MIKIKNTDGTWSIVSGNETTTPAVDNNTIQINASQQLEVKAVPPNKITNLGSANGVASLDSSGKVPVSQIPGAIDQIVEVSTFSELPATGEANKIYVTLDTNKTYRWGGTAYVEISASLALGETENSAYRGDRGKTAYDHSQTTHARVTCIRSFYQATEPTDAAEGDLWEDGSYSITYAEPEEF